MASEKAQQSTFSDAYQPQAPPPPYQQQAPQPTQQPAPPPIYHQPGPSIPPGMTVVNPSTLTGYQTNGVTVVNHTPGYPGGTVTMVPMTGGTTAVSPVVVPAVGRYPTAIQCRSCHANVMTKVSYAPSFQAHLAAGLLFIIGCWPFCLLPYCMNSCKNADHYCPNCNAFIGFYN